MAPSTKRAGFSTSKIECGGYFVKRNGNPNHVRKERGRVKEMNDECRPFKERRSEARFQLDCRKKDLFARKSKIPGAFIGIWFTQMPWPFLINDIWVPEFWNGCVKLRKSPLTLTKSSTESRGRWEIENSHFWRRTSETSWLHDFSRWQVRYAAGVRIYISFDRFRVCILPSKEVGHDHKKG